MNLTTENVLLIGSLLLFASLLAGKTSSRFGVPVLIFFLAIGMLAGSEGIGGIHFNSPKTAQFIGIIGLNFILFSGGFSTDWKSVKPILLQGVALSTVGVLIIAITLGVFMWYWSDFTIYEGLLLGSIVSSTDSAAVFSILRSKKLALKGRLRATLELESGSNDPMAYILTIALLSLVINKEEGVGNVVLFFLKQFFLGGVLGFVFGKAGSIIINRIKFDFESLYVVLVIALMFFSFSFTDFLGGNGFLAVYLCGIYLGNQGLIHKRTILKTFDSYAWLMQIVLFLTLGLLVFPSQIVPQISTGLACSAFLIFIARPLSVFASLVPFRVRFRERLFISWVGLRGAVPIVFATYPLLAGAGKAQMIFNIVFFISLTSVIIQGTTLPVVAKWLRLTLPLKVKKRTLADLELEDTIKSALNEVVISPDSRAVGKQIYQLWLPKTTLISIIQRNNKFITPTGSTVIQPNDRLFILSEDADSLQRVYDCLGVSDEP
jgi:cell volume regulation protein A